MERDVVAEWMKHRQSFEENDIKPPDADPKLKALVCEWEPAFYKSNMHRALRWETKCGASFSFPSDDLREHNYIYCPKCGKAICDMKKEELK